MKKIVFTSLLALAACGSSGTSSDTVDVTAAALSFGTSSGSAAANGLDFATALSDLSDVEGAGPINIKVARALTDWDSGTTRLVISDETLEVESLNDGYFAITLNGERLVFDAEGNPEATANGSTWESYFNTEGQVSGTGAIYDYARGQDPMLTGEFDTEAFFVFGIETDPAEIAVMVGEVVYNGGLEGYGQLLDASGNVFIEEVNVQGSIELTVSFDDTDTVNGSLNASLFGDGEDSLNTVDMTFSTGIEGNGYAADLVCTDGCADQSSIIAGAFFGEDALETSGLIGFDISAEIENPDVPETLIDTRFISGAGFTATQDAPAIE